MEAEQPHSPAPATTVLEAAPSSPDHGRGERESAQAGGVSPPQPQAGSPFKGDGTSAPQPQAGSPLKADVMFPADFRSLSTTQFLDPSATAAWKEKAGAFFSSSSLRIRNVASKAGSTVAGAAGGASVKMKDTWQGLQPRMAEAASKASESVKETWETTKDSWTNKVAPRMEAGMAVAVKSATDTGNKLRQGIYETTEKVKASRVGQRLSEMTVAGVERSQELLSKNEWRTKTMRAEAAADGTSVFGVPLEEVAARGAVTGTPVPSIVSQCSDFLLEHGVATPYLFETEGDPSVVKQIMKTFDEDKDATIPSGTDPLDVAQLLLVYCKCLPEPLLTHRLYADFVSFGGTDVQHLCRLLRTLPTPNLETLNRILLLLHRVAQHAEENKMDAQSLAAEVAPVLLWKEGIPSSRSSDKGTADGPPSTGTSGAKASKDDADGSPILQPHQGQMEGSEKPKVIVDVDGNVASAAEIPVENDEPSNEQTALVEAIMVLIEQHPSIFSHSPNGPVMLLS